MRLTRCFVDAALAADAELNLPADASAHLARVLRARVGDAVTLFDGRGGEHPARITAIARAGVQVRVGAHQAVERESPLPITLLQALARGERMDWIVQKATELGVARIVPVESERSVVRIDPASAQHKQAHWRQVAISACEQCGRNRIPRIDAPTALQPACSSLPGRGPRLMLAPDAPLGLTDVLRPRATAGDAAQPQVPEVALLIGPEGGWSDPERQLAHRFGFTDCRLGPRVLRTETAPLAALAAIQALAGDLASMVRNPPEQRPPEQRPPDASAPAD